MNEFNRTSAVSIGLFLVLTLLAGASEAAAQATGLPTFYAPTRAFGSHEWGLSLSRPGGRRTGIEARWGTVLERADLNLRGGWVDGDATDGTGVIGVEVRVPVVGHSEDFPLDGALILGLGYIFDPEQPVVPIGFSLGRRIDLDNGSLELTPFFQPTLVFTDDSDFVVGLGLDVRIERLPEIRIHGAGGDWDGISFSLFWPR